MSLKTSFIVGGSILCFMGFQWCLHGEDATFSADRLQAFHDLAVTEQNRILQGSPPPTTAAPLDPAPLSGYLPIVITNTTGLPADQVYVTIAGQQTAADLTQYFFQLGSQGILAPVAASSSSYSPTYSYPLSQLPVCSTGAGDYIVYAPSLNGVRLYFSVQNPMYLITDTIPPSPGQPPNKIVAPTYYAFYDPNYNNLFDSVEITFSPAGGGGAPAIPWTASVNTTAVDAFCLPISIAFNSYSTAQPSAVTPMVQDPNALPSGFGVGGASGSTTRNGILTTVVNGLTSGDMSGATPPVWPRLAIPFYSNPYAATGLETYLRVLSPKQSLGNSASPPYTGNLTVQHLPSVNGTPGIPAFQNYNYPPFPADYLTNTIYGDPNGFARDLFTYYNGGTSLYMSTGGGSPTVYQGTVTGTTPNQLLTMTGVTGTNTGSVSTLAQSAINTFSMYSGSQLMSGGPDGTNLGFFFGDAFTVGVLPSTVGTSSSAPINITDATASGWEATNIANYYLPENSGTGGGPWYDLYAKLLHSVALRNTSTTFLNNYGLCYGYDFDDSLGISGTITPVITTSNTLNPYLRVTLGSIDTTIPNPYSDPNSYDVTFNFPGGNTLLYSQGGGAWTSVSSGQVVNGLYSNSTTPLQIQYTNNQGPTGVHEFTVYLYYQFLVPLQSYNDSDNSVINATTIIPNSATPTGFTINMLP